MNYENTKNAILKYIDDRNEYLRIYQDIRQNIDAFKKVTKPYKYIPKELLDDFIAHLDGIIEEHADVFDLNNRSQK